MTEQIIIANIPININYKKIRNIYLRIHKANGTVSISAPAGIRKDQIEHFVLQRKDWIEKNIKQIQETTLPMEYVESKKVEILYRKYLKVVIDGLILKWESRMQVKSSGFTIRKMKSRWGSCNTQTAHLNFNLELAKAPIDCIEYVVVHELCHIIEPSHNARFWEIMGYYLENPKQIRKKLREVNMNLPSDPYLLVSVVNTKLRDEFSSLEELAVYYRVDPDEIRKKLERIDYVYYEEQNKFC